MATPTWKDPDIKLSWIHALQKRIDESDLTLGGAAAGKACIGKDSFGGQEIGCPHKAVLRSVRVNECDLDHKHTETLQQMCLLHGVRAWGAGIAPAGGGPLLEGVE